MCNALKGFNCPLLVKTTDELEKMSLVICVRKRLFVHMDTQRSHVISRYSTIVGSKYKVIYIYTYIYMCVRCCLSLIMQNIINICVKCVINVCVAYMFETLLSCNRIASVPSR